MAIEGKNLRFSSNCHWCRKLNLFISCLIMHALFVQRRQLRHSLCKPPCINFLLEKKRGILMRSCGDMKKQLSKDTLNRKIPGLVPMETPSSLLLDNSGMCGVSKYSSHQSLATIDLCQCTVSLILCCFGGASELQWRKSVESKPFEGLCYSIPPALTLEATKRNLNSSEDASITLPKRQSGDKN